MWSTRNDLKAYNAKIAQAEKALAEAQSIQETHNAEVSDWRERWTDLAKRIDGLGDEVKNVYIKLQRVQGRKISDVDQKTGLPQ